MAFLLLSLRKQDWSFINDWTNRLLSSTYHSFVFNGGYPCNLQSYPELIEHPKNDTDEYKNSVTKGSILYPYLAVISVIFDSSENYEAIRKIRREYLSHCNFQAYFFDEDSEQHLYSNSDVHGATLSNLDIEMPPDNFLQVIIDECGASCCFRSLSVVERSIWPIGSL